jgi:ABC-type multidrug transport system fused ATPase/permease subunit
MVMDAGRIVEFDNPGALLGDENSFFRKLVDQSADREVLMEMRRKAGG